MAGIPSEVTCTLGDEAGALGSSDANSRMDVENHACNIVHTTLHNAHAPQYAAHSTARCICLTL
jgi:hypothetical protein